MAQRNDDTPTRLWNKPDVPHKGWRCIQVCDLQFEQGEDYVPEVCEMCGQENLRFVHFMQHADYGRVVRVGCVCAEKMECDRVNPKLREQQLVNRMARRSRWLNRKWRVSAKGNHFLNIEACNVVVYPDKFNSGQWRFRISDGFDETTFSDDNYATPDEAKLALFDTLADLLEW
jgi:hypothetical protein